MNKYVLMTYLDDSSQTVHNAFVTVFGNYARIEEYMKEAVRNIIDNTGIYHGDIRVVDWKFYGDGIEIY